MLLCTTTVQILTVNARHIKNETLKPMYAMYNFFIIVDKHQVCVCYFESHSVEMVIMVFGLDRLPFASPAFIFATVERVERELIGINVQPCCS